MTDQLQPGHERRTASQGQLWSKQGQSELLGLSLATWATQRRTDLLELLKEFDQRIAPLDLKLKDQAQTSADVQC